MALHPTDQAHRDNLVAAAHTLREVGKPELADSVDYVLSPMGAGFVGRLRVDRLDSGDKLPSLPMKMPRSDRELIKRRAKAVGDSLSAEVAEAFRQYLDGDFVPQLPERAPRGSGDQMVNLNVRPDDSDLFAQVDARCAERRAAGERIYTSNVAADWLYRKYKVGRYADITAASE